MRRFCLTFSLILCSLTSIKCQIRPDFCATSNFDGVFYLGQNITFKNGPQFWQYDSEMQRTLPRVFEDIVKVVTTSLFINEVPNCDKLKDCQQLKKALNVIFIRMIDINTFEETTRMARFNTNYELADVTPEQYPWGLTDPAAIWPKECNNNPIASKPSLFLPYKNQVYFITNHNEEYSELHYRTIDSTNWYQSMSKNRLTADIRFAGMFHTYGAKLWSNVGLPPDSVFAVGHIKKHPKESKLFRLDSNYTFVSEDKNLLQVFGCHENYIPRDSDPNQDSQELPSNKDNITKNKGTGINFIVVILLVCVIGVRW